MVVETFTLVIVTVITVAVITVKVVTVRWVYVDGHIVACFLCRQSLRSRSNELGLYCRLSFMSHTYDISIQVTQCRIAMLRHVDITSLYKWTLCRTHIYFA
jgi:hypothetical protein